MAGTRCEQTDRQTDGRTDRQGDSYIPPQTLFAGGIMRCRSYDPRLQLVGCFEDLHHFSNIQPNILQLIGNITNL